MSLLLLRRNSIQHVDRHLYVIVIDSRINTSRKVELCLFLHTMRHEGMYDPLQVTLAYTFSYT